MPLDGTIQTNREPLGEALNGSRMKPESTWGEEEQK